VTLKAAMVRALLLGILFLVALWAFVSYLEPAFSGERSGELLYCL